MLKMIVEVFFHIRYGTTVTPRGVYKKPKLKARTKIPKNWSKWMVVLTIKKSFNGTLTKPIRLTG